MPKIHGSPHHIIIRELHNRGAILSNAKVGPSFGTRETNGSAVLRRDPANALAQNCNLLGAVGQMDSCLRRSPIGDAEPTTPLGRRTDGPRRKAAAAVGTDIVQLRLDAVGAESTFEGANTSVRRI